MTSAAPGGRLRVMRWRLCAFLLVVAGCSGSELLDSPEAPRDASPVGGDGGVEAGADAGSDAAVRADASADVETRVDAGFDASVEAGADAEADASADAGAEAGVIDAGPDATAEAGVVDAGPDVGPEPDAGPDAGVDAGPEPDVCQSPSFVVTGPLTATDSSTGLTWYRGMARGSYTAANSLCPTVLAGGRLPTTQELLHIMVGGPPVNNHAVCSPAVDTNVFPHAYPGHTWTSDGCIDLNRYLTLVTCTASSPGFMCVAP